MATTNSSSPRLTRYLSQLAGQPIAPTVAAFLAGLDAVEAQSPNIAGAIASELRDQRTHLKLIASENYCSLATQLAQGNLLTDKYAEGFAGHRFYAGCDNVDTIENEASELACKLFGADHAYVQPHSGADANLVAFASILAAKTEAPFLKEVAVENPANLTREAWNQLRARLQSQKLLALDYYSGGHLTHGYRFNMSARMFDVYQYRVQPDTKLLDLDAIRKQLHEVRPTVLLAGYSAYPRRINFAKMREMADEVGAVFMVDMAHFAGLVAGKVFTGDYNPVPHAHVVTSTTHKTLRGPRGGIVLCKKEFAEFVDKGCPAILGGPLPHVMAAKAVAFREALAPEFETYAKRIVENAGALAAACQNEGMSVLTGGTDNHLLLVDVAQSFGLTGRQAESVLRECRFTLNRNSLPDDPQGPWYTSGLRLGTAAVTTLGMGPQEMREIAAVAKSVLAATKPANGPDGKPHRAKYVVDSSASQAAQTRVLDLLKSFPLYPELGEV
ncbi:MAG TPA: glycine hydroxymethyltransferase [Polyangiaceae bacterium]